jgi:hypothetical protein
MSTNDVNQLLFDSIVMAIICGTILFVYKEKLKEFRVFIKAFFYIGSGLAIIAIIVRIGLFFTKLFDLLVYKFKSVRIIT